MAWITCAEISVFVGVGKPKGVRPLSYFGCGALFTNGTDVLCG